MPPAPRPQWQQATALITIGAGGIATGLSFVPKAAADLTTPASIPPVTLLALEHANAPAPGRDAMLRAAIVHIARHFQRLAETRSPAEMEAMIWQYASTDGTNHGPSCGAFASLTLELGSHIAGVDNWVTGGTSYPWPVHSWVDGRVDPNSGSPGVVSIVQDARSHGRWRPLGDGYTPQAGDWVLFDGHVEVVTKYHGGVLHTIGGDSLPNMSVNAHEYADPLQAQGVAGFVDNGVGMSAAPGGAAHPGGTGHRARPGAKPGSPATAAPVASADPSPAGPVTTASATAQQPEFAPRAISAPRTVARPRYAQESRALRAQGAKPTAPSGDPSAAGAGARPPRAAAEPQQQNANRAGTPTSGTGRAAPPAGPRVQHGDRSPQRADRSAQHAGRSRGMTADVPATGLRPARPHHARPGEAAIPGLFKGAHRHHPGHGRALAPYHRHDAPPSGAPLPGTTIQQAFINEVANGAMATQRKYGVPASVTIAQAIDESGWGQSALAASDHNLFGIKGTGPAGSDEQPTQEVINGQIVNLSASFQIYQNIAQSIDAHGRLLAHSGDYAGAMARSKDPNAFAASLTGVYATDPGYGAKLVQLMKQYDLYRFDRAASHDHAAGGGAAAHHRTHGARRAGPHQPSGEQHPARTPAPPRSPGPHRPSPGHDRTPNPQPPGPIGNPVPVQPAPIAEPVPGQPAPIAHPVPVEPGPMTAPRSRAHDAKPPRSADTGASLADRPTGAPRAGRAAGHAQAAHHDGVTPPAATLYPGRSARPAPLAHPARPADLARPAGRVPSHDPGPISTSTQAQQPGLRPAPAPGTSHSSSSAGGGQPARHNAPGSASGPGTGSGPASGVVPGRAGISADAAIPGIPHAAAPRTGGAHARRPIGRLRPAHNAGRPAQPTSRAAHPRPTAAGSAVSRDAPANGHTATAPSNHADAAANGYTGVGPNTQTGAPANGPTSTARNSRTSAPANAHAGMRSAATPPVQPPSPGNTAAATPRRTGTAAAAPTVSRAADAIIPGLRHHGLGAHVAGLSGGASPAGRAGNGTAQPGESSIPGAQQGLAVGAMSQAVQPGAASGHSSTARHDLSAVAGHPSAAPAGQATSPGRPGPGHAAAAHGYPPGPTEAATSPGGPAPQVGATHPAAGPAPTARAARSAAPSPASAQPRPGAASPAPAHTNPAPARADAGPASARPTPVPANRVPAAVRPTPAAPSTPPRGGADVPGLVRAAPATAPAVPAATTAHVGGGWAARAPLQDSSPLTPGGPRASSPAPGASGGATLTAYHAHMPVAVRQAFLTSAKMPLLRCEPLYRDVASHTGIRWEILAACDWMQCKARHGYSPVYGEKLGALNPDDTCYRTKSAALEQCASDLVQLARSVYQLDIATGQELTVRDLANVFGAFRWGGLLRQHCTSAMDFPYSVAGLTADHTHMRWPNIGEPNAPDKPGSRFRQAFGAVPVVLSLNYQALM